MTSRKNDSDRIRTIKKLAVLISPALLKPYIYFRKFWGKNVRFNQRRVEKISERLGNGKNTDRDENSSDEG